MIFKKQMRGLLPVAQCFLFFLIFSLLFLWGVSPSHSKETAAAAPALSNKEKKNLVKTAVKKIKSGDDVEAKKLFLHAQKEWPENPSVNYYLGIIYLKEGDKRAALNQWIEYLKKEPESKNSLKIRKNITLLQKDLARSYAKETVANERGLASTVTKPNSLAITYFKNLGSPELEPLKKGMAAMLITDLSKVEKIKIVERMKLQALYDEMALAQTGFLAENKTIETGKLLKAEKIVSGNYADFKQETLEIASTVTKTKDGQEIGTGQAKGKLLEFYELEKLIAYGVLADLGFSEAEIPDSVRKIHTKNFKAFAAYSAGLDHFDNDEYDKAREKFQEALILDPNFQIARTALLITPLTPLTTAGIISTTLASAPSSSAAAMGMAFGTKAALIGGGVLGTGAVVAVAGGIGGGGNVDENGQSGNTDTGDSGTTTPREQTAPNSWVSTIDPENPAPGQSVNVIVSLNSAGVSVSYSVMGSDGFQDNNAQTTDSNGQLRIFIPGGGEGTLDTVTVSVPEWGPEFNRTWTYTF